MGARYILQTGFYMIKYTTFKECEGVMGCSIIFPRPVVQLFGLILGNFLSHLRATTHLSRKAHHPSTGSLFHKSCDLTFSYSLNLTPLNPGPTASLSGPYPRQLVI